MDEMSEDDESGLFPPPVLPGSESVSASDAAPPRPEPKPVTTTQTFGANGQTVTTITDAAGNTTVITTNGERIFQSAVTTTTDEDGNTVTTTIDASNKATVVVTDPDGVALNSATKVDAPDAVASSVEADDDDDA